MTDLIDTTEMYLRTVFELEEEGVTVLRARIVDRLRHSGPTVSQTVARMERDGLLAVMPDRSIELSTEGRLRATRVMRKHRLAELLLRDVIGLEYPYVHDEACRWEHVMSERVERKLVDLLDEVEVSPYGNPVPGLAELGVERQPLPEELTSVAEHLESRRFRIDRLGEPLQVERDILRAMQEGDLLPGAVADVISQDGRVRLATDSGAVDLTTEQAAYVFGAPLDS